MNFDKTGANRYSAKIIDSSKELSTKQGMQICDMSQHKGLSELVKTGEIIEIDVAGYAVVSIHNPKAKNQQDYDYLVVIAKDGASYFTGSDSFCEQFFTIWEAMKDELSELKIEAYVGDSKNYETGFLTCRLV